MKNIYHKRIWWGGAVQIHVEAPPIPLIKSNIGLKIEKDYVGIELNKNPRQKNQTCMNSKWILLTMLI